jgi:hypothetical protein
LKVDDGERVLLAVAWVSEDERRLFELFPEVTFWDSAQKTNCEKRPLFLACGKDSENHTFTYLRAFMPSECQWVFEWLYTKAMPILLGRESLKKTKLSLTDGDKNEYGPLKRQIVAGTFASSQHGLCGFHLIDRSMVSNPFGKPAASKEEAFLVIKRHIKKWTISWMSTVESKDEFETSKSLLFAWLDTWEVMNVTGKDIARNIQEWLVKHVLLYVEKTLLYPRLFLLAFHEYVNSVAEIEVSAMKNGNDVMPYMRIGSLAKNIQEKYDVCNNFKQATALRQASSVPLWSKTLTSPVVTRHAEGILQQQYTLGMKPWFNCVRTDSTTWLVRGGIEKALEGTPIPKFIRTRMVSQVGTFLLCSCGFFERFGLPCRHLFVVLQRGPRPSDCATRWRRDYLAYGLSGNAELD